MRLPQWWATHPSAVVGFGLQLPHLGDLFQEVRLLHTRLGTPTLEQRPWVSQDHLEVYCKTWRKGSGRGSYAWSDDYVSHITCQSWDQLIPCFINHPGSNYIQIIDDLELWCNWPEIRYISTVRQSVCTWVCVCVCCSWLCIENARQYHRKIPLQYLILLSLSQLQYMQYHWVWGVLVAAWNSILRLLAPPRS